MRESSAKRRGKGGWNAAAGSETMLSPYILFPVRIMKKRLWWGWGGEGMEELKKTKPRVSKVGPSIP